jgi:hypothetical protein
MTKRTPPTLHCGRASSSSYSGLHALYEVGTHPNLNRSSEACLASKSADATRVTSMFGASTFPAASVVDLRSTPKSDESGASSHQGT